MDTTALVIAGAGTALFIGVLVWKGLWFLRKISEEPEQAEPDKTVEHGTSDSR